MLVKSLNIEVEIDGVLHVIELEKCKIKRKPNNRKRPVLDVVCYKDDINYLNTLLGTHVAFDERFFDATTLSNMGIFYESKTIGNVLTAMGYTEKVRIKIRKKDHYISYNPDKISRNDIAKILRKNPL